MAASGIVNKHIGPIGSFMGISKRIIGPVVADGGVDQDLIDYIAVLPISPTAGYEQIVAGTLSSLKQGNYNWGKIDLFALMATDYRQNSYYSLKNASQFVSSEKGSMYWNQYGFKGNSNSYVASDFIPSADGVNYTDNSACFFYWSLTDLNNSNANDGGCQNQIGSPEKSIISFSRGGPNTWYSSINDNSGGSSTTPGITSSIGFFSLVRKDSSTIEKYLNGVLIDTITTPSTGLPDLEAWIFGLNRDGILLFESVRQLACYGFGSGTIDQMELYNSAQIYVNGIMALYPSPPPPSLIPINNPILNLSIPSLIDQSGNGWDSVLGASTPVGFTSPTIDGDNNIVFNGLQTIKLNNLFNLTLINTHTQFLLIYCDAPETTQNVLNIDTAYAAGTRIFVDTHDGNKFVTAGAVFFDEAANTQPVWGRSLPKIQSGYNLIGLSFSPRAVYMYLNGMVSYFSPNNAYPASALSGWLGAFPGGTSSNMYTLPAYFKLPSGSNVEVFNYSATQSQIQDKGNFLMFNHQLSSIVFEVDSITQGFTLTTNAETYSDQVLQYLLLNTPYKWAGCNMAIGGRAINEAAVQDQVDSTVTYNWTSTVVISPISPVLGSGNKNVYVLLGGVNDIADGRTLSDLQSDFTTIINFRNGQGYKCFVLSVTGDGIFDPTQEQIRLDYNAWLATQQSTLNFIFVNICSIPGANTSPMNPSLLNDAVHWNATMNTLVAAMLAPIIEANL